MANKNNQKTINAYPDEITLDNGKKVRLGSLNASDVITVQGHRIRVADIPLVVVNLKCGCMSKGIALTLNDIVFCEKHQDTSSVVEVLAK